MSESQGHLEGSCRVSLVRGQVDCARDAVVTVARGMGCVCACAYICGCVHTCGGGQVFLSQSLEIQGSLLRSPAEECQEGACVGGCISFL